ncbi:hypothetical protein [Streptomyces sp. NPDC050264]|uniref:hypothetical protein n=1 Tax=Streptomyces sp. NPDC050264 TaxID=3155038 RepID=UPI00342B1D42
MSRTRDREPSAKLSLVQDLMPGAYFAESAESMIRPLQPDSHFGSVVQAVPVGPAPLYPVSRVGVDVPFSKSSS